MCSKHVEAWNKLIIKFSASSWLILINKYIEMHGQQNIKIWIALFSYPVPCIFYYFVQWPTNAQLFHKLSHSLMFRHYRVILRELEINTLPSYTSISNAAVGTAVYIYDVNLNYKLYYQHLNCKLYYQQLHLKYLCNLARYCLQVPWGWHDSVETFKSVIICEIIVHLLAIAQNEL